MRVIGDRNLRSTRHQTYTENMCIVEMSEPFSKFISHALQTIIRKTQRNESKKKCRFNFFQGLDSNVARWRWINAQWKHNIHMAIIWRTIFLSTDFNLCKWTALHSLDAAHCDSVNGKQIELLADWLNLLNKFIAWMCLHQLTLSTLTY